MSQEPSALGALLARVEAATGADRELDATIACALDWNPDNTDADLLRMVNAGKSAAAASLVDPDWRVNDWMPAYTSSLDAALSLVERLGARFCWRVHKQTPSEVEVTNGRFWATCGAAGEQEDARGETPALALIAAMLKALAASTAGPIGGQSHRLDEQSLPSTESEGR